MNGKIANVIYNILKATTIFLGLYFLISLNNVVGIIVLILYVFLYMVVEEYRKSLQIRNYVDKYLFNELYKRYKVYKKNEKYLPFEEIEKIKELDNQNGMFEEEIEQAYYFTNL